MSTHPEIAHLAREERIRLIAYALWEEEGRPHGRDLEHWQKATQLVEAEASGDPDWLQRAEPAAAIEAVPAPSAEAPTKASLDELVKRMKGSRAA
jgi:hypothetical protein